MPFKITAINPKYPSRFDQAQRESQRPAFHGVFKNSLDFDATLRRSKSASLEVLNLRLRMRADDADRVAKESLHKAPPPATLVPPRRPIYVTRPPTTLPKVEPTLLTRPPTPLPPVRGMHVRSLDVSPAGRANVRRLNPIVEER